MSLQKHQDESRAWEEGYLRGVAALPPQSHGPEMDGLLYADYGCGKFPVIMGWEITGIGMGLDGKPYARLRYDLIKIGQYDVTRECFAKSASGKDISEVEASIEKQIEMTLDCGGFVPEALLEWREARKQAGRQRDIDELGFDIFASTDGP